MSLLITKKAILQLDIVEVLAQRCPTRSSRAAVTPTSLRLLRRAVGERPPPHLLHSDEFLLCVPHSHPAGSRTTPGEK